MCPAVAPLGKCPALRCPNLTPRRPIHGAACYSDRGGSAALFSLGAAVQPQLQFP